MTTDTCSNCAMQGKDDARCWQCLAAQETGEHLPLWVGQADHQAEEDRP